MAGTSDSNSSNSSHTLTGNIQPPQTSPTTAMAPTTLSAATPLLDVLPTEKRHLFLQPTATLPTASLALAKETLDSIAAQVADEQQERIKSAPKRKRGDEKIETLKLRKVFVDGFETGQVWQQAKRIVAAALREGEEVLRELERNGEIDGFDKEEEEEEIVGGSGTEESEEEGSDEVSGEEIEEDEDEEEDEDLDVDADMEEAEDSDNFDIEQEDWDEEGEDGEGLDEEQGEDGEDDEDFDDEPAEEFVEDPNGLNDGFFSIDEFNKQTQYFEEQDARADPNTDAASDDEELNWHADPMAAPTGSKGKESKKASSKEIEMPDMDEDDNDDEGDGPTFGNMDLDAPEGASDDEDDLGGLEDGFEDGVDLTANDIFYKDFFAPPARKVKTGNQRKGGDYVPKARRQQAPVDEGDVERAMNNVHRDLFDDLSEHSDDEDALSEVDAGDPKSRRSTHERRQAKLAEEIRKLEAEAVAKRDWTLSGETTGTERPINSLLEQDLAFEHVGKPVPVITEEVSESIEELIKRRILAQEFDELIRRRPGAEDLSADRRRGMIELDDSKAKQSLAELYEEEHVKNTNPDSYVSKEDEKLRKEEKEVENLWRDVCARLDALSSWHYKPKPAAPSLTVVADVATIAMEDAQPATAQGVMGGDSALAPQEIYQPGKETAEAGEVVAGGLPVARQEMSREEKLRRRRREKERIRKSGADGKNGEKKVSKKSQEKKDTMDQLKKGGVRVINRKGEVVDVDGNKAKAQKAATSGSFKL
ncbi:U3 snoRNP protein [Coniochaeta pulveracea]|uniref:U3 small nucleolar ribonucleoprotein protein MPP10 n=1 Tax=Coniochaeta pulveracea TaxID=177199 RepID=A0A420YFI2_9PEZI|nr:U3 snoRNP protein [Coniochaeta pulveracea]